MLAAGLSGQISVGRIAGNVTDGTGAVIPGVKVTARNERTGLEQAVTTQANGQYLITQLLPAAYTVTMSLEGFTDSQFTGIALQVAQERTVNAVLQPAGIATEIAVSSGGLAQVDTSSARIGANVSEREVSQLPLNGRQVSQLYLMAPGAVNSGSGAYDNIRFSGRSNQENVIRFDGVEGTSIVDASPGSLNGESTSLFRLQQSLENVQEFRVDTSNYPAEYGTGTGGQISFVTKSGSSQFHGSLFEYIRNDSMDARNFFDGADKSKLRLNQFGGSIGGPIAKDKAFFFAGYEALRQRTATPFVESTLSAAARAKAVPSIRPLLAAFPIGQFPTSDPTLDVVTVTGPGYVDEDSGSVRFDYNLTDRFRLYARYFRDQGRASQTQNSTLSRYQTTAVPQNAVLSLNQVWTPALLNETKIGFNGSKTRVAGVPGPSPDANINGVTLNLTGSVALGGIAGQVGNAALAQPTGLIRLSSAFNGRGAPYTNDSISFIDNLSVIRGSHNFKFGGEVRRIQLYNDQLGGTTYSFANIDSFLNNKPASIAFNGDLGAISPFTALSGVAHLRQNYYILYAQDEWKIRPNVTLSYGLRYEYYQPLRETRNKNVYFNMLTGGIIPKYDQAWYHSSTKNFGPRLGLSWSPNRFGNRTVFRIGGGYFYGPGQTEDQLQPEANDRIGRTISGNNPLNVYPLNISAIYAGYNINDPNLGYQPRAYAPGYTIPERILEYTASVQQTLPGDTVLTVAYVGSQGRNLFLRGFTNLITGVSMNATGAAVVQRRFGNRFAEIDYKTSGGASHYDSLQMTINRRFSTGFSLSGQYTYGHDIGNSAGSNEANTAQSPYDFGLERGNNNFDIRQSANFAMLYDLPFGRGKKFRANSNNTMQMLAGSWQVGGLLNLRSGVPIDVLMVRPDIAYHDTRDGLIYSSPVVDTNGTIYTFPVVNTPGGGASRNVRRPDVVAGVNPYRNQGLQFLNPAVFSLPAPGSFGNSGRNGLHGPNLSQFDLTASKRVFVTEGKNIEFRAEIYNLFNHANFANPGNIRLREPLPAGGTFPGGVVPAANFRNSLQPGQAFSSATAGGLWGTLNSTVANQIGLGTNRQVQLSLRFTF
ncbi:MAG: TonB-dependent receptor [Bryobacterales bacterium]|nr:TonB-dependent receptor [Bryobacterales bacterium]